MSQSSTPLNDLWQARFGFEPETALLKDDALANLPAGKAIELLLQHRTHRVFEDKPISDEVLNTLLGCTLSAPSKSDLQQGSIVIVDEPGLRGQIAELIPAMPWISSAPVFMIFLADGHRIERICKSRGKPFANDNLDNFLAAISDASLMLQNTIIAAEALGLGCCPISVIRDHMATVAELLHLPSRVVPLAGLCLGYPAREGFVSMRLPPAVTVHRNHYDVDQVDEGVNDYDRRRDARFSLPADRQKYKKDFGMAAFYGWSEDKARQMAKEERATVGQFAREHGFTLR
ncbi:MAG: nitroreductase family protein [Pseudomonadota bacterium]